MNLRSLRYFLMVAELGTLAAASRQLRVAQPALSRHLAALEADCGTALFLRHRRGVTLTEAGQLMRERGTAILAQIDGLRGELHARLAEPRGPLAIGIPPSLASVIAAPVAARFTRQYPQVRLQLREAPTEALLRALADGELDATAATIGEPTRHFAVALLAGDHMGLVAPPGTELDRQRGIRVADLAGRELIVMANARFMLDRLDYAAAKAGVRITYGMEVNSMLALPMVAAGLGYSFMPMCALAGAAAQGLAAAPILDLPIEWGMCTPRDRPPSVAVTAFVAAMRAELLVLAGQHDLWPRGSVPDA